MQLSHSMLHVLFSCFCSSPNSTHNYVFTYVGQILRKQMKTAPNTAKLRMTPGNSYLKSRKFEENQFFLCPHSV